MRRQRFDRKTVRLRRRRPMKIRAHAATEGEPGADCESSAESESGAERASGAERECGAECESAAEPWQAMARHAPDSRGNSRGNSCARENFKISTCSTSNINSGANSRP